MNSLSTLVNICFICLLLGCSNDVRFSHGDEHFYKNFTEILNPPIGKENCGSYLVNLSKATNFAWDSVYFFIGEEGPIYISNTIGFKWNGPSVPNLYQRLLFVKNDEVVSYIDCPKENNNYTGQKSLNIIMFHCQNVRPVLSRKQAVFITSHMADSVIVSYPLIPLDCYQNLKNLLAPNCIKYIK